MREVEKKNGNLRACVWIKIQNMEHQLQRIGFQAWSTPVQGNLSNDAFAISNLKKGHKFHSYTT
jgi:hypothetical protein